MAEEVVEDREQLQAGSARRYETHAMRRQNLVTAALALGMAITSWVPPGALAQRVVPGEVARERVERLTTDIQWHNRLQDALAEAQREGKLVFWVQMLGQIDGAT